MDYSWINVRIATGAALSSPDDVTILANAGVTAVVDARAELDDAPFFATHPDIMYLWNPTQDDGQPKPPEYWAKTLSFSLPLLAQPHQKLYLHCAAGVNRGPSNAFAVLCALGIDSGQAETMIRTARPQVGLAYRNDAYDACRQLGYV